MEGSPSTQLNRSRHCDGGTCGGSSLSPCKVEVMRAKRARSQQVFTTPPVLPASAAKAEARRATTCLPPTILHEICNEQAKISNTKMFQATAAVQVSCQGQMDLHRIQSIPYPVPSPLPPLLFTAHDARCGVSRKCNLLSPSLSPTLLPSLTAHFRLP